MSDVAERQALKAERDFLLRSLADLDDEHNRGELTDEQFDHLVATYTARAAAILRTLDHTARTEPMEESDPRRPRRRPALALGAVLAAVVGVGAAVLPGALGTRGAGDTITGNAQSADPAGDDLARAVQQNPDDPEARLAYARLLLDQGQLVDAVRQYDAVSRLDPDNAEALGYSGWIIALSGITDAGLERLDAAIAADPDYPDAHLFRGMTLFNTGRSAEAIPELERYLELVPDSPQRVQVEALIDQARTQTQPGPP